MSAVIRAYEARDHETVAALVVAVLEEHGFGAHVGGAMQDLARIAARYAAPRGGFWVAEQGGVVVGTVAVRPKEGSTCELKRLYVRGDLRGSGLGQRLYEHAERFAKSAGYETIWLDSSRRFDRAHRLYRKNGYVLLESRDNEWEDDVLAKRI